LLEGVPPAALLARLPPGSAGFETAGERGAAGLARVVARLAALDVRVVPLTDPAYPPALAELCDAPSVLLVRGDPGALSRPSVAIVGARAATVAARGVARRLGRELASAGLAVVSGLARGIDGEAHRGALEAGGRSVGVLACGLDRIYPPEHRGLVRELARGGAVISELPLGAPPRRLHFPLRNRIISGLCLGVVVVEARRRSGSLITARHALDQGREVFVVPGAVEGPFAEGGNQLLRDGARPVRNALDILDDLGVRERLEAALAGAGAGQEAAGRARPDPAGSADSGPDAVAGGPLAAAVLGLLRRGPATRDELLVEAGLDPRRLARALLELELAGRIVEERDGRVHVCGPG